MTRFQAPDQTPHSEAQQDLFQEFEANFEANWETAPPLELLAPDPDGNGDRPLSTPTTDTLEQEIEQITAAAIALEEHLGKANGELSPELQQSIEQIMKGCQGLSGRSGFSPGGGQQLVQWLQQQSDRITAQIRQHPKPDAVLQMVTTALQPILKADRVLVYQFNGDDIGSVVAEALVTGWTPSRGETLPALTFGPTTRQHYLNQPVVAIANGQQARLFPYQRQLFERFQIQSSLSCAIVTDDQVWGLLVVQQCRQPRLWQPVEMALVRLVAREVAIALQVNGAQIQAQSAEQWSQSSLQLIYRVTSRTLEMSREAISVERIMEFTCRELRRQVQADRVAVYRFNADWSGQFISEDKGSQWVPVVGAGSLRADRDTYLQETQGGRYRSNESFRVDDIYAMGHADCHIQILEEFQARAYVLAPIFSGSQLWGLLAVYQNTGPRQWQEREEKLTVEVAAQLGLALNEAGYARSLKLKIIREAFVSQIVDRIRQGAEMADLSQFVCQELRQVLECDRVAVYRFNPDWTGEFIAESVADPWLSVLDLQSGSPRVVDNITDCSSRDLAIDTPQLNRLGDTYIRQTQGRGLTDRNPFYRATNDIYAESFSPCYIEVMESMQVRAYVIGIIYQPTGKPWGMLAAYHCSVPRRWEPSEIDLVVQVSKQLTIAVKQGEDTRNLSQALEREKAINKIVDRIRQKTDITEIAQFLSLELRQGIRCDRVAVYRFNPDWTGRFIAESVSSGWVSVMDLQNRNQLIMDNITECSTRDLARPDSQTSLRADTQIRQTQGGSLRDNNPFYRLSNDIYTSNFSPCYIEALEAYEVKAYIIGIIYNKSGKPWGLLATYQCSAPRQWTSSEIDIVVQLSNQLSIAVQQAEYVSELQQTSQQLAETAEREKQEREQLQQQIVQILMAVRPALDGDLTVRAPVTENLVGTVADAYNNTIQSLRQLVAQVKTAAAQVDQTSEKSQTAIAQMADQTQQELAEINQAFNQIQAMVNGAKSVATDADQVNTVVQRTNQVVQDGDQAMNRAVEGITTIRTTVAETTQKIKRLSEASQKISKVVNLIQNFTTQTNLLALNAAIEATRAGEYGRGFAVVADEVRLLSQQSAEATAEIERLVQEIQSETSAVSAAMDMGIEQVVKGTSLVTETRHTLNDIVSSTAQISELTHTITAACQAQNQQSETVIQIMNRLAKTALQTSDQSTEITQSFQKLLDTSEALQSSVGQFKID